jgi:hypothetical protein
MKFGIGVLYKRFPSKREDYPNRQTYFDCCLSVHVDNYTIIVPTKCTSLLKAQDITICTFLSLCS